MFGSSFVVTSARKPLALARESASTLIAVPIPRPRYSRPTPVIQVLPSSGCRFAVIVKTERFKKFGDIPDVPQRHEGQLEGLVINTLRPLGYKEKKLLKEEFPNMDFDKVLVVEENRKPSSWAWCATFQYGGMALIGAGLLLGIVFIVRGGMAK